METFSWPVSYGTQKEVAPRVRKAQYGDGYSQRVGDGINTDLEKWSVQLTNVPHAEADSIETFLKAHGGYEAFYWTRPGTASPITVICPQWSRPHKTAVVCDISAAFEQVPDPT